MDKYLTLFFLLIAIMGCVLTLYSLAFSKSESPTDYYKAQEQQVQAGGYFKRSLLNKSEQVAYQAIIRYLYSHDNLKRKYKVFSQVNLGEFLGNKDKALFSAINSKRVDFLLTDTNFNPVLAIEINGSGHYIDDNAERRDSIKQSAIENAGIAYDSIEIQSPDQAKQAIQDVLNNFFGDK